MNKRKLITIVTKILTAVSLLFIPNSKIIKSAEEYTQEVTKTIKLHTSDLIEINGKLVPPNVYFYQKSDAVRNFGENKNGHIQYGFLAGEIELDNLKKIANSSTWEVTYKGKVKYVDSLYERTFSTADLLPETHTVWIDKVIFNNPENKANYNVWEVRKYNEDRGYFYEDELPIKEAVEEIEGQYKGFIKVTYEGDIPISRIPKNPPKSLNKTVEDIMGKEYIEQQKSKNNSKLPKTRAIK